MVLSLAVAFALAKSCAPAVAPATLLSVARAESRFNPLAIGVNGRRHQTLHPATVLEALQQAEDLTARKANFDIGLAQINAANLSRLKLSLEDALDPCRNLAGEARVLTENYLVAQRSTDDPQAAIRDALSRYNTGDAERGLNNGYVARVYAAAAQVVPALRLTRQTPDVQAAEAPVSLRAASLSAEPPSPPTLDVFSRAPSPTLVWGPATSVPPGVSNTQDTRPVQNGDSS